MYEHFFNDFLNSSDTLRVYEGGSLIYTSQKERMLPLLEYIEKYAPHNRKLAVFDKIMGNGAALLCAKINCQKVFSPMGSELAIRTLVKYGISYQLTKVVPYIARKDGEDMCPIELLSVDKDPEDFYKALALLNDHRTGDDKA